ncbi:hypothetical protein C8Q76DRAFT_750476 [Earliella scabrosa]|nr:hypothetical protein C8Q76DRAFT_750476 [Earliella scabrosa]
MAAQAPAEPLGYPAAIWEHTNLPFKQHSDYGSILAQTSYNNGGSSEGLSEAVLFDWFKLRSALDSDFRALVNPDRLAFADHVRLAQKLSVRILLLGHPDYTHQVNILRTHGCPPTRAQLAVIIAREVNRFLKFKRDNHRTLYYLWKELTLDDLVLHEVRHVSRGSIMLVLGVL